VFKKTLRASVLAAAALAAPITIAAQQPAPAPAAEPQQELQQELQSWVVELQQIQAKLAEIQAKALEDAQLQASQEAIGAEVKASMEKLDPALAGSVERVQALEEEAAKAQQSGDQAKLQQLAAEAQGIEARFMEAQAKALEQPELANKIESFQSSLEKKMAEVDPQAPALIQRYKELGAKIQSALKGTASR
jgi:chaperonin cofactor prefoldin